MRFKSKAWWPKDTVSDFLGNNITTDSHYSEGEAIAVCARLELEGFGGERKIFPLKTEVIEIARGEG